MFNRESSPNSSSFTWIANPYANLLQQMCHGYGGTHPVIHIGIYILYGVELQKRLPISKSCSTILINKMIFTMLAHILRNAATAAAAAGAQLCGMK